MAVDFRSHPLRIAFFIWVLLHYRNWGTRYHHPDYGMPSIRNVESPSMTWSLFPARHAQAVGLGPTLYSITDNDSSGTQRVRLHPGAHCPKTSCLQPSALATQQSLGSLQDQKRWKKRLISKNNQQKNLYTDFGLKLSARLSTFRLLSG